MSFVCTAKSLGRIFRGVSCAPAAVEFGTVLLRNVFVMVGSRSSLAMPPPPPFGVVLARRGPEVHECKPLCRVAARCQKKGKSHRWRYWRGKTPQRSDIRETDME